jgi:biopolymer transport protein ExbD
MVFRSSENDDEVMSEINVTPLVDVMLVLLIIFMITVPVMKQAVQVQLPQASSQPLDPKPQAVRLTVDAQGHYFLDQTRVSLDDLRARLSQLATREPQPALHIWADRQARYDAVAQGLSAAQRAGLNKVGFVTDQPKEAP